MTMLTRWSPVVHSSALSLALLRNRRCPVSAPVRLAMRKIRMQRIRERQGTSE